MKYALIFLCSAALAPAAAIAEDTSQKKDTDVFQTLDKDADGRLSQTEAADNKSVSSNFTALDSNSDGFVTKSEFKANTMPKSDRPY